MQNSPCTRLPGCVKFFDCKTILHQIFAQLNEGIALFDAKVFGGRDALNNQLNKAVIAVARAANNESWLAIGNVLEAVVTHNLSPSGFDFFTCSVSDVFGPGSGFAVTKVVDIGDREWGVFKVFEFVSLCGELDPLHVPLGDAGEEFETAELGVGNGAPEMLGEFAGFDHVVENCGDVIHVNMLGQAIFVNKREG